MRCQNCGYSHPTINKTNASFGMKCPHCKTKLIAKDLECD